MYPWSRYYEYYKCCHWYACTVDYCDSGWDWHRDLTDILCNQSYTGKDCKVFYAYWTCSWSEDDTSYNMIHVGYKMVVSAIHIDVVMSAILIGLVVGTQVGVSMTVCVIYLVYHHVYNAYNPGVHWHQSHVWIWYNLCHTLSVMIIYVMTLVSGKCWLHAIDWHHTQLGRCSN